MVQLRSCYFCGAVGESLEEYDLVPETPASAEPSPSAVLCSTCREKLRRVLEPLVESRTSAAPSGGARSEHAAPSAQDVTFDSGTTADPEAAGDDDVGGGAGTVNDPAGKADDDGSEAGSAVGDGDTPSADDGRPTPRKPDGSEDDDGPEAQNGNAGDVSSRPGDVPEAYHKVLRLLQNREFPMERAEMTALVTGAYDVSKPECDRIIETAIERGVLVERGSALALGRD
jgi:hypothetical protein